MWEVDAVANVEGEDLAYNLFDVMHMQYRNIVWIDGLKKKNAIWTMGYKWWLRFQMDFLSCRYCVLCVRFRAMEHDLVDCTIDHHTRFLVIFSCDTFCVSCQAMISRIYSCVP